MKISTILIGMLVFIGAFTGFGIAYFDTMKNYGLSSDLPSGYFNETFNSTMGDINDKMSTLQTHSIGVATKSWLDPSKVTDALSLLFIDIGGVLASMIGTFQNFMSAAVFSAAGIPIPGWFISIVVGAVLIIVLFRIITIAMRSYQDL